MDLDLTNKRIVITGASQGIGEGIAHAFAAEGANLHLVASSADKLSRVAKDIEFEFKVDVRLQPLDLTLPDSADQVAAAAPDVDVLINNAGAIPGGDLWKVDARKWRSGWELKVLGYIDLTRAIYPIMKERASGVIVNNIGNGGENFDFDYIAGSSGNASLMAFTRSIGGRSLDDGIRVVGVNPGMVATERVEKILKDRAASLLGNAERYREYFKACPLGRPASIEEVASLIVFLASPRSGYTSGAIFTVDGGMTSRRSI